MSFSQFTENDFQVIEKERQELMALAKHRCANDEEFAIVGKAFDFANEAHKNIRRRSGEPYILHPIAVARIVIENIGLGYKSISAALLHDVVEDTEYTVEDIKNLFGAKIASLVDGLTKVKTMLDNEDMRGEQEKSLQAENFKRILLTLNDDVRVVLIKLADRLHNCRTIAFMPEHKRDKILSETMFIFIPLAHRLGLYEVKSELENIWLRFKEPDAYNEICARIDQNVVDRDKQIDDFIAPIKDSLQRAGFDIEIKKRVKTPYSIWHKMQTKNVEFEQVYDLYAVRIVFTPNPGSTETERDQCYHIFSIITGIYRYLPDRMRDWVKHPKSNGYEALHCTLMSQVGIWVEVQIRSRRMDDIAEKGIAAHWTYKQEGYITEDNSEMDKWLLKLKDILDNPDFNSIELLDIIHNDLVSTDIVVFTPKGEQKTIAKGATALDFAYMIHSHIGHKAIAAKVNMKLESLSYVLRTGDQVEIITAQNSAPKVEWLKFLTTRHARQYVIDAFHEKRDELAAVGKAQLREALSDHNIGLTNKVRQQLIANSHLNDLEELCYRVGLGIIDPEPLIHSIGGVDKPVDLSEIQAINLKDDAAQKRFVICTNCNPIPGDPVVGFRTPDGLIHVHKKTCSLAEEFGTKHGDWTVNVKWDSDSKIIRYFPVRISISGIDRMGICNDITSNISSNMGINMRKLTLGAEDGIFEGFIEVLVTDKSILDKLIATLKKVDGIQKIVRTDI